MLARAKRGLFLTAFACAGVLGGTPASVYAQAAVALPACDANTTLAADALDVSHRRFDKVGEYSVVATAPKRLPGMALESITLYAAQDDEPIPQGAIDGFDSLAVAAKIEFGGVTALEVEFLYRDVKKSCLVRSVRAFQLDDAPGKTRE